MYKLSLKILLALSMIFAIQACKPTQEQIVANMNTVIKVNKDIDSLYLSLNASYDNFDNNEQMDAALQNLKDGLDKADQKLQDMEILENCQDLKKAISDKIVVMKQLAAKECSEQVRIYKIDDADFNDKLRAEWDAYAASAEQKMKAASKKVSEEADKITNPKQ